MIDNAPTTAATVTLDLRRDHYDLLRRVLWGAGMAYQMVDGDATDAVLRMDGLTPDFRDLMRAVAAAAPTESSTRTERNHP